MSEKELKDLQQKARRRLKLREDPRFKRTIEVLQSYGLLYTRATDRISGRKTGLTFADIEFAGNLEPRVFEVLPALAYRRPKALIDPWNMPEDLKKLLEQVRLGLPLKPFRSIEPSNYLVWIEQLRRKNSSERTIRKDFRFSKEDLEILQKLGKKFKLKSQTEVVCKAIRMAVVI